MGNEATSQSMSAEWSGSLRFGNDVRKVDFFYKPFEIPGRIVSVEEIVRNEIILVVNKVKWYGLRLIICDCRSCGNTQPDDGDYEVLKLTDIWGVSKESLETHIQNIKYYFQSAKYADAPWEILKQEYDITRKYPPRRRMELKVDINGMPSEYQRNKIIEALVPGDMLIITRPVGYDHYAIYVGDGYVINIDQKKNGGGAVKESFHTVCGGGKNSTKCVKVEYKLIEMTPRSLIVEKAFALYDEKNPLYKGAYNVLIKNCEHFARGHVEAGKDEILKDDFKPHGRCTQVEKAAKKVVVGVAVLGTVGAVGGAVATGAAATVTASAVTKAALVGAIAQAAFK